MFSQNFLTYSLKISGEIVRDILFFPLWWYSRGLVMFFKKLAVFLSNKQKSLALIVWIKNIFRPMYGQTDWQGKLISIFMRLMQIILRSFVMLFWVVIALIFFCVWIILPPFALYEIFFQFY